MEAFSLLKYWRRGEVVAMLCVCTFRRWYCRAAFTVPDEDETEENEDVEEEVVMLKMRSEDQNDGLMENLTMVAPMVIESRLVPIETNSSSESKSPQFPVSLLKSATKFRVFLLRLKKSKLNSAEKIESGSADEPVSRHSKSQNNRAPTTKEFSKDVMQKYLKKVKPLYVRVSRRYGEKLKLSGKLSLGSLNPARHRLRLLRIRVVCKHLGKSRSASSAVAAVPPTPAVSKRSDDSLLQQQDGIQGAILHCKRSFNGCQDSSESSVLPRSVTTRTVCKDSSFCKVKEENQIFVLLKNQRLGPTNALLSAEPSVPALATLLVLCFYGRTPFVH
ncbi:putative membrane-associated kinase regulator 2 [Hibiscus syriacus]|uniref:Membrane-associated kinase regulator 2 n=1 Tax=Hibiscus syriacus TaxID=106335 RepID=A0A6A2X4R2_HIBSY|nr:putative membrane-associated kinase regulator 2 [Hibiscus syriacus]